MLYLLFISNRKKERERKRMIQNNRDGMHIIYIFKNKEKTKMT